MGIVLKSSFNLTLASYIIIIIFNQLQAWFQNRILQPRIERNAIQVPEAFMTTPEIIVNRGYPVEIHQVHTEDGYILELHRIPHGRRDDDRFGNETFQRRAVFLQHGMFCNDIFWLLSSSNNSLAYILADHGYDVWLGNSRGNTYSRKHESLNPDKDEAFWNFSWDELGQYDIPASIDYVLHATGQKKLAAFFGYSLGSSLFFIGANRRPRLNDQVEMVISFGPTVSFAHLQNYYRFAAPFVKFYQLYQSWSGIGEVHANNGLVHQVTRLICETSLLGAAMGRKYIFQIFGESESYNEVDLFRLIGHHPAGGSANTMAHFFQAYNSGETFLSFDHGTDENLKRYGTVYPPEYNLTLVTSPVYLIYSGNDPFVSTEDIAWLVARLGNVKESIQVNSSMFSHGDFVWSPRAAELVFLPVLDLLPSPFLHHHHPHQPTQSITA